MALNDSFPIVIIDDDILKIGQIQYQIALYEPSS